MMSLEENEIEWFETNWGKEGQCKLCGSSIDWEECWNCGGSGYSHHDCGEDCCCCFYPEDNVECDICDGKGGWHVCISECKIKKEVTICG